jgi:hypothetical protein
MAVSDNEKRKLWVRAGGRCTLCKKYLLEGELTYKEVFVGEAAHIIGQKESAKSARGVDPLPEEKRDLAENLLLACSFCHTEIDKLLVAELIDKEFLRRRKQEHEDEIRHQTSLTKSRRTVILRMAGDVRGDRMELPRDAAVEAVIKSGGRFPVFPEAYDQKSVEVDLRGIDGEADATAAFYAAAVPKIDSAIDHRVHPGVLSQEIQHISVFAIARLPLLVYLGSKLDDGVATDVYQRQRSTQNWVWSTVDPGTTFELSQARDGSGTGDAVLIANLSGTTPPADLPAELDEADVFQIDPRPGPAEDLFAHPAVLARFEEAIRAFFTGLERTHKQLKHVHLIGAIPVSPAVSIGRILKSAGLRPAVVTYDRIDGGYIQALVV